MTTVFFEAPHRIEQCVQSIVQVLGDSREVSICRELTKTYEQVVTGEAGDLLNQLKSGLIPQKGEFVLIVRGSEVSGEVMDVDAMLTALLEELPPSRAAAVAAKLTSHGKSDLYNRALQLKDGA